MVAAGHTESEIGLGVRKGLVRLGQHKGWARLDAEPACWELEKVLSPVLVHICLMAPRWKLKVAAGTAMHRAELEDR